ncbi:hypothetical protein, partial [Aquimarina litoralis]|uniref:hypothetical protein n=1 Tax=Aquimarina litoralis TaxID=584605 RepID=UPI0031D70DA6
IGSCIFMKAQCLQNGKVSNQCAEKLKSKVTFCSATTHILNVVRKLKNGNPKGRKILDRLHGILK